MLLKYSQNNPIRSVNCVPQKLGTFEYLKLKFYPNSHPVNREYYSSRIVINCI